MANKAIHVVVEAFVIMLVIWGFKQLVKKFPNVPVVSQVVEEV